MSDDKKLSETQKINQNKIFKDNEKAKKGENQLKLAIEDCYKKLNVEYGGKSYINFNYMSSINQSFITNQTKDYFGKNFNYVEKYSSHIKPDGGFICYELQTEKFMTLNQGLLLCAEYKKQGDGKDQASGNAIERCYKNFREYELCSLKLPYFLYFVFCSGTDFKKGSSILDRLTALTIKRPFNHTYYEKEKGLPSASVYINENNWNNKEMSNIMFEGAKKVIDNYLIKVSNFEEVKYKNVK